MTNPQMTIDYCLGWLDDGINQNWGEGDDMNVLRMYKEIRAHLAKVSSPHIKSAGCICPAGANKDCENPMCPRKNPLGGKLG